MPYIDQNQDKEKKLAPKQGLGGAQATVTGGIPAVGGPSAGATQAQGSGKFVNFDRIFAANKGDAQNMAQGVADDVHGKASDARRSIDNSELAFNQQVRAGTNVYGNPPPPAGGDPDTKNGGLQGQPQKGGLSQDDLAAKAAQGYSGPDDYAKTQGYQDTKGKVDEANEYLGLLDPQRMGGRAVGLQTYFQDQQRKAGNGGSYTNGMSVWDASLTGAAGSGAFDALRKKYSGLDTRLDGSVANAAQNVSQAQANSADAQVLYGRDLEKQQADRAAAEAAAAQAAQNAAARQAQQDKMGSNAGNGDLQNTTTSINDEKAAMNDGLYYEWLRAGSPPYEQWKAERDGNKGSN